MAGGAFSRKTRASRPRYFCTCLTLVFLVLIVYGPSNSLAADSGFYARDLRERARASNLAAEPQWLALLHMERKSFGRFLSAVSAPAFFLAENGRYDPAAELEATLNHIVDGTPLKAWDEPAQCVFAARYAWLRQKLQFNPQKIPELFCPRFNEWYEALNPYGLTLIFPASFMNNPASAFGHTLLRIDQPGQTEGTVLLAYAANYSADTAEADNALFYAAKGVFGRYDGLFSVAPYYQKVTQYSDMENRDIWEYALNYTPAEVQLMTRHLWELRGAAIPYYYFDENCSYHLLSLLEVARPGVKLKERSGVWVIPSDTIRLLDSVPGLIEAVRYRPSSATKLRHRIEQSSVAAKKEAQEILAAGKTGREFPPANAAALDLAYENISYEMQRSEENFRVLQGLALKLLNARSALKVRDSVLPPAVPDVRPDQGHGTARLSLGVGRLRNHEGLLFELRPALHSLIDPEGGYLLGAQIEFLDTRISLRDAEKPLAVEKFTFLNLTSISPRNAFMRPTSWWLDFGGEQRQFSTKRSSFVTNAAGGGGLSYKTADESYVYLLAGPRLEISRAFDESHAFGVESRAGGIFKMNDCWSMQLEGNYTPYFWGDVHAASMAKVSERYTLNENMALEIELRQEWQEQRSDQQYSVRVHRYF